MAIRTGFSAKKVREIRSDSPWTALGHALPLLRSLKGYDRGKLRQDLTAGLTTAVMLVPQAMAYALLAGLPPIVGLYAALIPPLAYALLGTSRQLSVGPVAMDSLLVAAGVGAIYESGTTAYLEAAVLLAAMVGVLQLLLGVLRMGFLVNFLSIPVVSGFTSAAAILIGLSQLKHLLGVPLQGGSNAWTVIAQLPEHWGNISVETLVLGISAILLLFVFKKKFPKLPGPLFVVSLGAIIVSSLGLPGRINIVGDVPSGLPKFSLLAIDFDLVATLVPTALSIALVAFMESIAVSKTYAKKGRYNLSANRELMALGASNLLGSFFSGYPVTGGFSRTAVNAQAGAQTQLSAVFTSFFVGLSLVFLTPLFYFLPKAALASIIMVAVFGLIDYAEVTRLLRVKRSDLVLLVLTFAATLSLGAAPGLGVGVVASLGWFIYKSTQPHLAVLGRVPGTSQFRNIKRFRGLVTYRETLIVRLDAQFYFGNVAFLKDSLAELEASMPEPLQALILDASAINAIDSSAEVALRDLVEDYTARGVVLYLAGVKGPVRDVLQDSGLAVQLGAAGRCLSVHEALQSIGATPNTEPPSPSSAVGENGREVSGASARL